MKVVENDFIKYWIEEGILYSQFKRNTEGTLENIKAIVDLRTEISGGEKQYWCYEFKGIKPYDKAARDYADKYGQDHLYACAAVLDSHVSKFILNSFMKLKRTNVPLKGFTKKEEAVRWLKEMKMKNI